MPTNQEIKRKQAAAFIEEVLKFIHNLEEGQVLKNDPKQVSLSIGNRLRTIASSYGLEVPRACSGEAHNPEVGGMIDNCGVCLNSGFGWGISGKPVKVK